ncbi:MAG: 4a-hydroxytetrahydrobiopterin dehydratase, partial [Actinobacteria bacterium]
MGRSGGRSPGRVAAPSSWSRLKRNRLEPVTRASAEERTQFRDEHPDWELAGEEITRTFRFADFSEAMAFVTRVALAAEAADHHPDIDIRW